MLWSLLIDQIPPLNMSESESKATEFEITEEARDIKDLTIPPLQQQANPTCKQLQRDINTVHKVLCSVKSSIETSVTEKLPRSV